MSYDWSKVSNSNSKYVKWDTPKMTITGRVVAVKDHTFEAREMPDGTTSEAKTVPVIVIDSRERGECEVTVSNADLLEQVVGYAPKPGDNLRIEYLRDVTTSFGGKKKLFKVDHHSQPAYQGHPDERVEQPPF